MRDRAIFLFFLHQMQWQHTFSEQITSQFFNWLRKQNQEDFLHLQVIPCQKDFDEEQALVLRNFKFASFKFMGFEPNVHFLTTLKIINLN